MTEYKSFLSSKDLNPLFKRLKALHRHREEGLIHISDIFGDPLELAQYYVEPYCQHQNPADYDDEDPISVVRSPVFDTLNVFFNRKFAVKGTGKNTMFVLSDAGMGKTSLLMMIKLSHITRFWSPDYSCLLLKLNRNSIDEIGSIADKQHTILLLDSLDEDPLSWHDTEQRIIEIIEASVNFRRVIITCRTQFFPQTAADPFERPGRVEIGGFICPMIFLSFFDEGQVDQYLKRRFSTSARFLIRFRESPKSKERRAKMLLDKVRSLQFRPLLLAHIEDLIVTAQEEWDDYRIYQALIDAWLLREEVKLRSHGHTVSKEHLLRVCSEVAVVMQETQKRIIFSKQLDDLIQDSQGVGYLRQFNFGGRSLLNRNSAGAYRFSHYSIQEFLLVRHVLANRSIEAVFNFHVTDQMFQFIRVGLNRTKGVTVERKSPVHAFDARQICMNCGLSEEFAEFFGKYECQGEGVHQGVHQGVHEVKTIVLSGLRFDGLKLSGLNLSGLVFRECSFVRANLENSNLSYCDLRGAVFQDANLFNADLRGAFLEGAQLDNANLMEAKMDANLSQ